MNEQGKNSEFFTLKPKEEQAMKVLWSTAKALSAAEIAEKIPNRTWPVSSIQGILRSLEKKNAVKVDEITKIGKSYGRLFRPTISANEYASMQFGHYYQKKDKDYFSLLTSLLGDYTETNKENIIEVLESLMEEYMED